MNDLIKTWRDAAVSWRKAASKMGETTYSGPPFYEDGLLGMSDGQQVAAALCPALTAAQREECLELIEKLKFGIADLNFRTMMKVAAIRLAQPEKWSEISSYMVTAKHADK